MQKFLEKLKVEGAFFDCLLYKKYLYLWNVEGEQRVYNWDELYVRRNDNDPKEVPSEELETYLLKVTGVPGKSLPIDTNIMDGKVYVATSEGLFRNDAFNTYEARRSDGKQAEKMWDARLFSINRHPNSPLIAMSAGDDGLYELNLSAYTTDNLIEKEKNIYQVGDRPSHQADYWDSSIGSGSRGKQYVARFEQIRREKGQSTRTFIGMENAEGYFGPLDKLMKSSAMDSNLGELNLQSRWKDYEVCEFDEGLHIVRNGVLLLAIDEPVVKWRIYEQKESIIVIVLTDDEVRIYESQEVETKIEENYNDDYIVEYARDIIRKMSDGFPGRVLNLKEAVAYLDTYIKRLKGINNIDFIDASDWDRLTNVEVDYGSQVVYITKEWPRRFKDEVEEEMHRMVWGVDQCFVMAFKFGELNVYKNYAYPFVSLRGKRISASRQRYLIQKKYGEIVQEFHHPFCNEYRIKGDAFVYNVSFYHTDAVCALLMGKDNGWSAMASAQMLPLLTMDNYKVRLHEAMKRMTRLLLQHVKNPDKIADNTAVRKALNSLRRRVIEMMRVELECRKRDTYDYDERQGYDFGELEFVEILDELQTIVDDNRLGLLKELQEIILTIEQKDVINFPHKTADLCRLAEQYRMELTAELARGRYRRRISGTGNGNVELKTKTFGDIIKNTENNHE